MRLVGSGGSGTWDWRFGRFNPESNSAITSKECAVCAYFDVFKTGTTA